MFGQDLVQQAGGQAPQAQAPQAPQADPVTQINAKLDQILALLMEDKKSDLTEGDSSGATAQPQLG